MKRGDVATPSLGQKGLAWTGRLGVTVAQENNNWRGVKIQHKDALFNLLRNGGKLVDDLMVEHGDEKGYRGEDDGNHIVP